MLFRFITEGLATISGIHNKTMLRSSILFKKTHPSLIRHFQTTLPTFEGRSPIKLTDTSGTPSNSKDPEKFQGNVNYHPDFLHAWTPELFKKSVGGLAILTGLSSIVSIPLGIGIGGFTSAYALLGYTDMKQTRHTIRRNFPVVGHLRYLFETLRPGLYQYFIESDTGGVPFNREKRGMAYQRSKNIDATMPCRFLLLFRMTSAD